MCSWQLVQLLRWICAHSLYQVHTVGSALNLNNTLKKNVCTKWKKYFCFKLGKKQPHLKYLIRLFWIGCGTKFKKAQMLCQNTAPHVLRMPTAQNNGNLEQSFCFPYNWDHKYRKRWGNSLYWLLSIEMKDFKNILSVCYIYMPLSLKETVMVYMGLFFCIISTATNLWAICTVRESLIQVIQWVSLIDGSFEFSVTPWQFRRKKKLRNPFPPYRFFFPYQLNISLALSYIFPIFLPKQSW